MTGIFSRFRYSTLKKRSRLINFHRARPIPNPQNGRLKKREPRKAVAVKSSLLALTQCCIHVLPIAVSITLLWFNIYGYYIGAQLTDAGGMTDDLLLHLLQFAAKVHEGLIVASTAAVVFSVLRHQLLYGNGGLPLGLIGAGTTFSIVNYFWYV
jgi:hypothetical protein